MADYYFSDGTDLKVIILFIAENFKRPVTLSDITDIVSGGNFADYFQLAQGFAELQDTKLLAEATEKGYVTVTPAGRRAAEAFSSSLPFSVREQFLSDIRDKHTHEGNAHSVLAEYKVNAAGQYDLFCEINEAGFPVFSMSLLLPTQEAAETAKAAFRQKAQKIYAEIVKNLT